MPRYTIRDPQSGRSLVMVGDSPPSEAEITKAFLDHANATPLSEPTTFAEGAKKGAIEGMIGGARGFAEGVANAPRDLWNGVKRMALHPIDTTKGLIDEANPILLAAKTPHVLRDLEGAMRASATNPEGWGRPIGSQVGQMALTAAPEVVPAATQVLGRGVQAVGDSKALNRAATYSAVGNAWGGNIPGAILSGVVPPTVRGVGRGLQAVGRGAESAVDAVKGAAGSALERRNIPTPTLPARPPVPVPADPIATPPPQFHGPLAAPQLTADRVAGELAQAGRAGQAEDLQWLNRRLHDARRTVGAGGGNAVPGRTMPQALSNAIEQGLGGQPSSAVPAPAAAPTPAPPPIPQPPVVAPSPAPPSPTPAPVSAPVMGNPVEAPPTAGAILGYDAQGQPLRGFPQVTARHQPPDPAAVQAYRAEMGVKDTASTLRIPKSEVERLAPRDPNAPVQLPARARRRIDARTAARATDPTAAQQYLDAAPHDLAARYVQEALARALNGGGE